MNAGFPSIQFNSQTALLMWHISPLLMPTTLMLGTCSAVLRNEHNEYPFQEENDGYNKENVFLLILCLS